MLITVIIVLAIISVLWAVWSYHTTRNIREVGMVKKELASGKVIFHREPGRKNG